MGQFFQNPYALQKQQAMGDVGQQLQAYRPEFQQAQMNAMRQQMAMMQPMQNALGSMYGPAAQFDLEQGVQNPFSERPQQIGRSDPNRKQPK